MLDTHNAPAPQHDIGQPASPTIDVHAHLAIPAVNGAVADQPGLRAQQSVDAASMGAASVLYNKAQLAELGPRLADPDVRLAAMDRAGVDVQAVTPLPTPYAWADRDLAERIATMTNDAVVRYCEQEPMRLLPVGTVTLQHPDLAVAQLTRAISDLGMRGVQISTSAAPGVELDDPSLDQFWAAAEEFKAAVMIHPWGCSLGSRLADYYLFNTVGNPVETALALSRLLFSGVIERHPGLRLWSAHGGGYLPSYIVRADHAWHARPDARKTVEPPSALLRRTFVDSLVYTPDQLRHLVGVMGSDRVTLGSDYPFDMGVEDPVDRLLAAGFDPTTVTAIRGGNAVRLLGPLLTRQASIAADHITTT